MLDGHGRQGECRTDLSSGVRAVVIEATNRGLALGVARAFLAPVRRPAGGVSSGPAEIGEAGRFRRADQVIGLAGLDQAVEE